MFSDILHRDPLYKKVVSGSLWMFLGQGIYRSLTLIKLVVLARILSPEDFGVFGLALLSLSTLDVFSKFGFQEKLIRDQGSIESQINTVWTLSLLRGFVLGAVLFLAAPAIASFFDNEKISYILRILSISPLISGALNPRIVYLSKNLEFKKLTLYNFSGTIVDFSVSVLVAIFTKSVIALVLGTISGQVVRLILSHILFTSRLKLEISSDVFKSIYNFGKWVWWGNLLVFLSTQGDDIFVGKVLGTTMVGFYQMAYKISSLVLTEITTVVKKVLYPVYSKYQDDNSILRKWFYLTFAANTFLTVPFGLTIFWFAKPIILIFLGPNWLPMLGSLKILSIAGVIRSALSVGGSLFYSKNLPKFDTISQLIRFLTLAVLIFPLADKYELEGVSFAVLMSLLTMSVIYIKLISDVLQDKWWKYVITIKIPIFLYLLVAWVFTIIFKSMEKTVGLLWSNIIVVLCILVVYFLVMFFVFKRITKTLAYEQIP